MWKDAPLIKTESINEGLDMAESEMTTWLACMYLLPKSSHDHIPLLLKTIVILF